MTTPKTVGVRLILVPLDESTTSDRAVGLAVEMAKAFDARLTLLHVAPIREFPVLMGEGSDPREDERAQLSLGRAAKRAAEAGVEARVKLRHGHAADQILREVASIKPDLIVMGSRGISGAKGVLLGSVSQAVLRRSKVSVVLVR